MQTEQDVVTGLLMQMERLRMDSYEADSPAEERRLTREYGRLWKIVEPMLKEPPHAE